MKFIYIYGYINVLLICMNLIFSNLLISKSSPQIKVPIFVERRSKCVGCWAAAARSLARSLAHANACWNVLKEN